MPSLRLPPALILLILNLSASAVAADVRLNEFMASNRSVAVPNAVAGRFDDWIELENGGAAPVDLGGWHLSDNPASPVKWTFPAGTVIPAGGFFVVFASGDNTPDPNGNLHTNFSLSASGENLALTLPDGTVASEFDAGGALYAPQETDVSYGRKPGDLSSVYFGTATPGGANASNGHLRVAAVSASANRGFYTAPVTVSLNSATTAAAIYYTLDGSPPLLAAGTPAPGAALYTEPLTVSTTTVLRSAAIRAGFEPSRTDSRTYLFPEAVATQTRPPSYPTTWGGSNAADYDVDPAVSQSAADAERFLTGLRSLPTLSVSTTTADLFGPAGIYTLSTNDTIEAAVSAEYFRPAAAGEGMNAAEGFQIECALKVQGGSSRNYGSSAKHSFSLRFRSNYGEGKLDYNLFGGEAVSSFNSVQLRAMYNNSWTHSNSQQRARATMIRDQWMRDSLLDMGRPDGGHGRYVNLYLNGLFWGVYNLHERIDNDHFAAYRDGVEPESAFTFNPGSFTSAEQSSFNQMRAAVTSGNWPAIEQRLDVDGYIDYYIMQHFGHNDDLKADGNWRAVGGGSGNHPWRLYLWDSERVLENPGNTGTLASTEDGAGIITGLDHLEEFQVRFADRAWKHLTNGGALTNSRNRDRFAARVTELDNAITGESARWGDWRTGGADQTRTGNWLPAIYGPLSVPPTGGVLGNSSSWFPQTNPVSRTSIILAAWKSQTWPGTPVTKLPNMNPPAFAVNGSPQHGGYIPPGGILTLTGGAGELYVTTDGSDPRGTGGAVQAGLTPYQAGSAVELSASGPVRARWLNAGRWSALNEAIFLIEPPATSTDALLFSEIHYHPVKTSPQELQDAAALTPPRTFTADDFQFLEILNNGSQAVNLTGCRLTGGVSFSFGNVALPPGARTVVVENAAAFAVRYGMNTSPAGVWSGSLARNGEPLQLVDAAGALITSLTYSSSGRWPARADGDGSSLELRVTSGPPDDPATWRSSIAYHGTPGTAGPAADGRILINEVLAHTDPPLLDSIELVNTTAAPVDLSGWFLSDSKSNYRKYRFPDGATLAAGAYLAVDASAFNAPGDTAVTAYSGTGSAVPVTVTSPGHGLATGDVITLSGYGGFGAYNGTFQVTAVDADRFTIPAIFLDDAAPKGTWTYGQPFSLNSWNGEDVWLVEGASGGELVSFVDHVEFPASLNGESFGRWPDASGPLTPMTGRSFGLPNPGPRVGPVVISEIMIQPSGTPETDFEFVEIWNPGDTPQSLVQWTLRGDVDYDFGDAPLEANSRLVIVSFDPSVTAAADRFRLFWEITPSIPLAGPWSEGSTLGNVSGTVRLRRADDPPLEQPAGYPQVIEDEARYSTATPWPDLTSPGLLSLNRIGTDSFGSASASWEVAPATPGLPLPAMPPGGFTEWAAENNITDREDGDSDSDGVPNLVEYALGLDPSVSDAEALPAPVVENGTLRFAWQTVPSRGDVTVIAQSSPDLENWSPVPGTPTGTADGRDSYEVSLTVEPGSRQYLRLRATRDP